MRDPREEAERLVAAALAAVSMAANSTAGFATGSAECCVCPLCKAIAAARDPDPDFAERLATAAGDVAAGVASFLRQFSPPAAAPKQPEQPERPERGDDDTDAWHKATHETSTTDSDVEQD
ncbi:hypothetical protein ACQP2P_38080 [Dactylosporangium sp. CA-139114]|uniref:hypothetical protein n=1 Tax=Dactylosporangium sp. CA-139114 TaxID=3239931 RepID=UPI003D989D9E